MVKRQGGKMYRFLFADLHIAKCCLHIAKSMQENFLRGYPFHIEWLLEDIRCLGKPLPVASSVLMNTVGMDRYSN